MFRILKIILVVLCCSLTPCWSESLIKTLREHTYTNNSAPAISLYSIKTKVVNRFAETTVTSIVYNNKPDPGDAVFSVIIPEDAFITKFTMKTNNQLYESFIVGIDEASKYPTTDNNGAHVSVRNSNEFDITVSLKPYSKNVFKLYYEEVLERKKDQYEIIANIFPRQLVENLEVEVIIKEDEEIAYFRPPYLKTGGIILKNQTDYKADVYANITSHTGYIKFTPGLVSQFKLACDGLGSDSFSAQFVVPYDIKVSSPSQVLADGKYFVTFLHPQNLPPLKQFIIFVLDVSGSMADENRLQHLKEAMHVILNTISENDVFNIHTFAYDSKPLPIQNEIDVSYPATKENIKNAKILIDNLIADGGTNAYEALSKALDLVKTLRQDPSKSDFDTPKLVFLTDGEPTWGEIDDKWEIFEEISRQDKDLKVPIYTIALGKSADIEFTRMMALHKGFPIHIYDDTDKNLQLQEFYEKIKTPVLKNIEFKNLNDITDMTMSNVPLLFNGSEIVAAGKGGMWKITKKGTSFVTTGQTSNGTIEYKPSVKVPSTKLERLWAYLHVKQLLKDSITSLNFEELNKKATDLALKYSLVTDVTMLIATGLPNGDRSIKLIRNYKLRANIRSKFMNICRQVPWPPSTPGPIIYIATQATTTTPRTTSSRPTTPISTIPSIFTATPNYSVYESTKAPPYRNPANTFRPLDNFTTTTILPKTTTLAYKKAFSPESCLLNIEKGPCRAYTMKFGFDKTYGVCKRFRYGGCLGNENKFDTEEECDKNCITTEEESKCYLPVIRGPCTSNLPKWYFDKTANECKEFSYGGCRGNANKFESKKDCEWSCLKSKEKDECQIIPDFGPRSCGQAKLRYYYDGQKCLPFKYKGCDESRQGFKNINECKLSCEKMSVSCGAPSDPGHGNNYSHKWYFDPEMGDCFKFSYSGRGGNGNRFSTKNECEQICRFVDTIDKCNLPKSSGTCASSSERWYHDSELHACLPFNYHCYGNSNNFFTMDECNSKCGVVQN